MDPTIEWHREEPIIPGPIPRIKHTVSLTNKETSRGEQEPYLLQVHARLIYQNHFNIPAEPIFPCRLFQPNNSFQMSVEFQFPRWIIEAIESVRVDDIEFSLSLDLLYSYKDQSSNTFAINNKQTVKQIQYSQRKWLNILREMNYSESWLIEVQRPNIEGMDTVVEHLRKAADCISTRDYDNCMASTRIAWDSFKPLLESKWESIARLIDEGSLGQEGRESKSKRVRNLKNKVHKFSHVGIHREAYKVFPEDALLSYHLTVSMISYLSKWLGKVTREPLA